MKQFIQGVKRFTSDEEGIAMVEYGLLGALVAVVCVVALKTLGTNINTVFTTIGTCLSGGACK